MTGFALLFWGWESGFLIVAVIAAALLEASRWVRWRWDFSETDMNRIWDLSSVLFVGAAAISYATTDMVAGPLRFMQWLPLIFFPFVAAVAYGARDSVTRRTYFLLFRRHRESGKPLGRYAPYWYVVVCCAAASIANARDPRFYIGIVAIGAWLLWASRARHTLVWALMLAVVAGAGYAGHIGLNQLQGVVENKAAEWFMKFDTTDMELNQTRTAIGSVGQLKLSNRIVLRLISPTPPEKLRRASFDTYNQSSWAASESKYTDILPASESTWHFATGKTSTTASVSMFVTHNGGILPVPNGPLALDGLLAGSVETNRCGSIRAHETPSLVRYTVGAGSRSTLDAPPSPRDLALPRAEALVLEQTANELGLAGQLPVEVLRRVEEFFENKFTYSCYLKHSTSVSEFLSNNRSGHCEYFATATTLLLRQAGIPARYAIGYAVPEQAEHNVHLVRDRHAHAWVLAYVDGTWHDFDTTPGGWEAIEEDRKPAWEGFTDFFGALRYYFAAWRYYGDRGAIAKWLLRILPVGLVWFIWRLVSKNRRLNRPIVRTVAVDFAGKDSDFYRIEKHLAEAGHGRRKDEPLLVWLARLERAGIPSLREVAALHSAYRFDPRGVTRAQRQLLATEVEKWLAAAR